MSLHYRVLYGLRIKPWDREGPVPELVAAADGLAPGRALDLGGGTGAQSVFLAREGWEVTAVDAVPRALAAARRRAEAAGVVVDFRRGDVAKLEALGIGDVALAFDRGCFHGLSDAQRAGDARGVAAVTRSGAVLLLMSFRPPTARGLPHGAMPDEVRRRFGPPWRLMSEEPPLEPPPSARVARARPPWYRFERS
jgi:SAM-dependent methyltransferase